MARPLNFGELRLEEAPCWPDGCARQAKKLARIMSPMPITFAQSTKAAEALVLVTALQQRFVELLEGISREAGSPAAFTPTDWQRDGGSHGGGTRFSSASTPVFNRASVNVSQVHYDDLEEKKLGSATALSAIVHPSNPFAPSIHLHVSWTEYKSGVGYWRIMADLNPSIPEAKATARFEAALRAVAPDLFERACEEGDRYFFIPALGRYRGVSHYYLEGYQTEDLSADAMLASDVAQAAIDIYGQLVNESLAAHPWPTAQDQAQQLAYHTLYLFQVLTLDRGTTTGLLVHDQNDLGIMGSLPGAIDRDLLASWRTKLAAPQDELLTALVAVFGEEQPGLVNERAKQQLAQVVREHYRKHPEALELQASAAKRPPTSENHR
ncbi:MAG: coproporphyrinogen III oxidase [Planctomycetota bacterium]|jgi:coproporphyrinogen III oxidase